MVHLGRTIGGLQERVKAIILRAIYCIIVRWNFLPPLPLEMENQRHSSDWHSMGILATALFVLSWPARCSNALFVISLIHEPRCLRHKLIMRARTLGIGDGHKAATAEMPSSRHQERACATLIVRSSNNQLLCSFPRGAGRLEPSMHGSYRYLLRVCIDELAESLAHVHGATEGAAVIS